MNSQQYVDMANKINAKWPTFNVQVIRCIKDDTFHINTPKQAFAEIMAVIYPSFSFVSVRANDSDFSIGLNAKKCVDKMFFIIAGNFWIGSFPSNTTFKTNKNALFLAVRMQNGEKNSRFWPQKYSDEDILLAQKTFEFMDAHKYIANLATFFIENHDSLMRYLIQFSGGNKQEKQTWIDSVDEFYLWVL